MREIKFRAWNKDNDEMVYSFDYPYHWNIGDLGLQLLESDGTDYVQQEAVFMQYTGLKDKNGTEIYEGDIIQPSNNEDRFYKIVFHNGGFVQEYRFIRKYEGAEWVEVTHTPIHSRHYKVIGNIHENPELLEVD